MFFTSYQSKNKKRTDFTLTHHLLSRFIMRVTSHPVSFLNFNEVTELSTFINDEMHKSQDHLYIQSHDVAVIARSSFDDKILGLCLLRVVLGHWNQKIYEVNSLCVLSLCRGMGLGSRILKHVQETIENTACMQLYVDQGGQHDALFRFYEKNHFKLLYSNNVETCMRTVARIKERTRRTAIVGFALFIILFSHVGFGENVGS